MPRLRRPSTGVPTPSRVDSQRIKQGSQSGGGRRPLLPRPRRKPRGCQPTIGHQRRKQGQPAAFTSSPHPHRSWGGSRGGGCWHRSRCSRRSKRSGGSGRAAPFPQQRPLLGADDGVESGQPAGCGGAVLVVGQRQQRRPRRRSAAGQGRADVHRDAGAGVWTYAWGGGGGGWWGGCCGAGCGGGVLRLCCPGAPR
jgi:hypothetical protein